jgi:hypothetical protein
VAQVTADPRVVEVTGPESSIAKVKEAVTETVSVDGARDSVTETVTLGFVDPSLRLKNPGVANATVRVRIARLKQ